MKKYSYKPLLTQIESNGLEPKIEKNILIIGNAGYILKHEIGEQIDKFNGGIARLNDFAIKGYEKFIGTRCDWWFGNDRFFNHRKFDIQNKIFLGNRNPGEKILKRNNSIFIGPKIVSKAKELLNNRVPSGGILCIAYFMLLGYIIYLHGFDCCEGERIHYYDDGINDESWLVKHKNQHHKRQDERRLLDKLMRSGDIRWLIENS